MRKIELLDFLQQNNLKLSVKKRGSDIVEQFRMQKYYAQFDDVEVLDGRMLIGEFGNGDTPTLAIRNYIKHISNKTLVLNAYGKDRKEIKCPSLKYSKTIKQ